MSGLGIFKDYAEQHALIGAAACDIIFEEQDAAFRVTKNLEIRNGADHIPS